MRTELREIVLNGTQSEHEQLDIIRWHHDKMAEDNNAFPYCSLILDLN